MQTLDDKTMTIDTILRSTDRPSETPALTLAETLRKVALSVAARLLGYAERRRGRLALLEMSDDQLKDIGLSRADAWAEGSRSIWDRN